eukprot:3265613-Pyramimonas_sp.AAC.1
MEGGPFSTGGLRLSAAHIRREGLQQFREFDCQDVTTTLIRNVEVPTRAFRCDLGSSERNRHVDARL